MTVGRMFKMTVKTRIFLFLHGIFTNMAQWFINHCDCYSEEESKRQLEEIFRILKSKL